MKELSDLEHSDPVGSELTMSGPLTAPVPAGDAARLAAAPRETARLYQRHFGFVWHALRRLGVPPESLEDAAHDVFLVVHRRLATFEGRSSVKTWLFGIALRVAKVHRRQRAAQQAKVPEGEATLMASTLDPHDSTAQAEAARLVEQLIDTLPEERRMVFWLAELQEVPAPEIAHLLGIPLNTVYSRLRLARRDFEESHRRLRASDAWRAR